MTRNPDKSYREPRKQLLALGIDIDLERMTYAIPLEKKAKVLAEITALRRAAAAQREVSVRDIARGSADVSCRCTWCWDSRRGS